MKIGKLYFEPVRRSRTLSYVYLGMTSGTAGLAGGIILQGHLPIRWWVPYDCSSPVVYWFTIAKLTIAMTIGIFVNLATETLVYGFCLQTCAQLEILTHRLQRMASSSERLKAHRSSPNVTSPNRASRFSEHISHHLCIIRFVKLVLNLFLASIPGDESVKLRSI